jgi:hypothetical protein
MVVYNNKIYKIVATCTTLPDRYDCLEKMLKSLHNQSYNFDAIYLCLPYKAKRLNMVYPKLPEHIEKLCTVIRTEIDYGPICKLYGALISEKDKDTLIVTIDDDCEYSYNMVEKILEKHEIHPNSAITGAGVLLGNGINLFCINSNIDCVIKWNGIIGFHVPKEGRKVDIIQGVSGVLYKRGFFPETSCLNQLFKYAMEDIDMFKSDDIVISAYLDKKKILKYVFNDTYTVKLPMCRSDGLSYELYNMIETFSKTIEKFKKLGFFKKYEKVSLCETPIIKVPIFLLSLIILIILILYFIFL